MNWIKQQPGYSSDHQIFPGDKSNCAFVFNHEMHWRNFQQKLQCVLLKMNANNNHSVALEIELTRSFLKIILQF